MKIKLYNLLPLVFVLASAGSAHSQMITTFAGSGSTGYTGDGGPATNATMYFPNEVAFDHKGNLYIADFYNNVVRKVDTAGIITTVAGNGAGAGSAGAGGFSGDGGPATSAMLNGPYGLAFDAADNLYIADGYNHNVRKVDATGIITNYAGNHTAAYHGDGGAATAAALNNPVGLAIDKAGNLYIADDHNHVVRKVTPAGVISTFAGNDTAGYTGNGGPATAASINYPIGVTVDTNGNVFIAEEANNCIRKVNAAGIISTYVAGIDTAHGYSGDGGAATAARLFSPRHMVCDDSGNLFISDFGNNVIRRVSASGTHTITTFAGIGTYAYSGDYGPATAAEFQSVNGVAVDKAGQVYVCDIGNSVIRKVGPWDYTAVQDPTAQAANAIQIYPNPTLSGKFTISLNATTSEPVALIITNAIGQVVKTLIIIPGKPQEVQLHVPTGVYFVSGMVGRKQVVSSVVVKG